ncbi:aspartic peptidase domain-containing protein [Parasitella parasitica]|nr:aspartic peptidase domain-containing protein [Parasitella parasitica]
MLIKEFCISRFILEKQHNAKISTQDRIRHSLAKFDLKPSKDTLQLLNRIATTSDSDNNPAATTVELNAVMIDVEYIGRVYIGNPPQEFHLNFDTGSAEIWVPALDCRRCGGTRRYGSNFSKTNHTKTIDQDSSTWQVRYGDGSSVSGIIGHDRIMIGNGISLEDYPFGIAKEQAHGFAVDPFLDGIFGLAFPAISAIDNMTSTTFVQDLHAQGKIKEPIVSFWLGRSAADDGQGEVMFGGVNTNHFAGDIAYIPVEQKSLWKVPITGVSINGYQIYDKVGSAILDTGTTLLVVPTAVSKKIHKAIPGANYDALYGWRMPCNLAVSDHKHIITITLGDHDFPLSAADLVRENVEAGNGLCYSGIAESQSPIFILGNTFLKNYYSVYDYGNMQIGLAASK